MKSRIVHKFLRVLLSRQAIVIFFIVLPTGRRRKRIKSITHAGNIWTFWTWNLLLQKWISQVDYIYPMLLFSLFKEDYKLVMITITATISVAVTMTTLLTLTIVTIMVTMEMVTITVTMGTFCFRRGHDSKHLMNECLIAGFAVFTMR